MHSYAEQIFDLSLVSEDVRGTIIMRIKYLIVIIVIIIIIIIKSLFLSQQIGLCVT